MKKVIQMEERKHLPVLFPNLRKKRIDIHHYALQNCVNWIGENTIDNAMNGMGCWMCRR